MAIDHSIPPALHSDGARFRGAFSGDGSVMSGTWSLQAQGSANWEPWMSVVLRQESRVG